MMTAQRTLGRTVEPCHGMDLSGVLHWHGRVSVVEERVVHPKTIGLRPAVDVPRLGGRRTAAG